MNIARVAASLLCLIAIPSQALEVSKIRYPWDQRPAHCPIGDASEPAECVFRHFTEREESRQKIELLYYTEQWFLLERALEDLSTRGPAKPGQQKLYAEVYEGLYRALNKRDLPIEFQEKRIKRWRAANPDSLHVAVAEAALLRIRAWKIRGTGLAYTVTPDSWRLFYELREKAERVLLAAPVAARERPAWHQARLSAVLEGDRSASSPDEAFEEAIRRWPTHYNFYNMVAWYMQPKWGGNWRALEEFASKHAEKVDSIDGGGLYARIYMYVGVDGPWREMGVDWPKLKSSFERLIVLSDQDVYTRNKLAAFACAARDESTFRKVIEGLKPHEIKSNDWLTGHSVEACKAWAFKDA